MRYWHRAKQFQTYLSISPVSRKEPASASLMTSLMTAPSLPPRSHAFGVSKRPTLDIWSRSKRFSMMPQTFFTILTFCCLSVNLQPRFWLSNLLSPRRLIRTKITRNSASCRGNFCSHGSQPAQLRSSRVYVQTTCSTRSTRVARVSRPEPGWMRSRSPRPRRLSSEPPSGTDYSFPILSSSPIRQSGRPLRYSYPEVSARWQPDQRNAQ